MERFREILCQSGIDTSSLRAADFGHTLGTESRWAVEVWQRLRILVSQTGCWPVILGEDDDLDRNVANDRTPSQIIPEANEIDPVEWLREAHRRTLAGLEEQLRQARDEGDADFASWLERTIEDEGYPRGPWPDDTAYEPDLFSVLLSRNGPQDRVYIGLIPARAGWEVPAILGFGGWNDCPGPEVHVALMKYWGEQFGAELMTLSRDVAEMSVARPPMDRAGAIELAKAKYLYCTDIVDQGTETLDRLAAEDLASPVWFFWWD